MILSSGQIKYYKELMDKSKAGRPLSRAMCNDLFDTIEALQQELFELKYGKYCRDYYINKAWRYEIENKKQKKEIKQLRKVLEQAREALSMILVVTANPGLQKEYRQALAAIDELGGQEE